MAGTAGGVPCCFCSGAWTATWSGYAWLTGRSQGLCPTAAMVSTIAGRSMDGTSRFDLGLFRSDCCRSDRPQRLGRDFGRAVDVRVTVSQRQVQLAARSTVHTPADQLVAEPNRLL